MKSQLKEKLYSLKYAMFHPFDGFYETKYRKKGSLLIATIILILYGILQCVKFQYTGFVMYQNPVHEMNSIQIFISSLSILLLFTVSNWTVTTLFNGKGNLKDIFIVLCYSLVPVIFVTSITVFVSNFVIVEEVMILRALMGIGMVWFIFLLISGLCVIHEYSFGVNLITLLATFIAAAIIVFLGVLFFTLLEKMFSFVLSIGQEFMRRLN
jgi:hypothetical protein